MTAQKVLAIRIALICGIVSSLLYIAMTVFVAKQWDGYRLLLYRSRDGLRLGRMEIRGPIRGLRVVGGLIVAYGVGGLLWPFAPMHLREVIAAGGSTLSDTMHLVLASVTVLLMLVAIGGSVGRPLNGL